MKAKRNFPFVFLFLFALNCFSQAKFQRTYGIGLYNEGRCVKQTFDGGYIIAGSSSESGAGSSNFYLLKIDSLGDFQWHKVFGGNNIDLAFSVLQTSDSGYAICGYSNSFSANNNYDAYLVRTDKTGDTLWTKTYGGDDWDFTFSVRQTSDAGFILGGYSYSNPTGNSEAYLVKTDSLGVPQWSKSINLNDDAFINAMSLSPDSGFVLGGYKTNLSTGNQDLLVIKTDASGDTVWTRTSGTVNSEEHANGIDVSMQDSSIVACGYTKDNASGNYEDYYVKYTANGGSGFTSVFFQPGEEIVNDIHFLNNGFIVAAYTTSFGFAPHKDFHFYKLDNFGNFVSAPSSTIGGINDEIPFHVEPTTDGGFIYCGSSTTYTPGLRSVYIVKFDSLFQTSSAVIGIDEVETSKIVSNYPNPFHDYTVIDLSNIPFSEHRTLEVFNVTGEEVFSSPLIEKNEARFYRNKLPAGIYLYRISSSGEYRYGKLIIE